MPSVARQFEPHVTRSGGAPSKFRFIIRCSACPKTDTYEAAKPAGDDLVKGYFKDRGWLLARDRAHDLCPACLAPPREAQQTRLFDQARRHRSPDAANHSDRSPAPADRRSRDTAEILARHLSKPEALAEEVFRPKPVQAPRPPASHTLQQAGSAPPLSPEMERALMGMAADLKGLRSTMELMAEQLAQLVALGGQQIEAIARLAPLVTGSAEAISSGFRDVVSAIQTLPRSLPPAGGPKSPEGPCPHAAAPLEQQKLDVSAEPEPLARLKANARLRQDPRSKKSEGKARQTASAPIVVKSIPDAKRPDRFYTIVRLPRELWDQAGFGPEDRLLLDWSGKALTIERATEGGVKPKAIGETSVVLQSWKLGNLNFDQPKVSRADASLRLTARPSLV
jgi:hypothetical protein